MHAQLLQLNHKFQDLVAKQYPTWVKGQGEVILTSQFLQRCLKPMWDPQTGKAALFIFDGMRYDIWEEFLKPRLLERMEVIKDHIGLSLLPSETAHHQKGHGAGTFPDEFNTDEAAGRQAPEGSATTRLQPETRVENDGSRMGAGTGAETVRYRIGNLDVYIFALCDKELHKIQLKQLPDGRVMPSRPLAFIYEQHIQNILDTEVMNVMKKLAPGTTVFVTADHGFGPVGRDRIYFKGLRPQRERRLFLSELSPESRVGQRGFTRVASEEGNRRFTPEQLRMPVKQSWTKKNGTVVNKEYHAVVFPRSRCSFSEPGHTVKSRHPTSHGGISMQELFVPMAVLRVKPQDAGTLVA